MRVGSIAILASMLGAGCQSSTSPKPPAAEKPAEPAVRTDPNFWIEVDMPNTPLTTRSLFEMRVITRDARQEPMEVEALYPKIIKYSWSIVRNHKPEQTLVYKGADAAKGKVVLAGSKRFCPTCTVDLIDRSVYDVTVVATSTANRSSVGGRTTFCVSDDASPCPR